jgi:type II secretory pathway pseudopilin PulG
MTMVSPGPIRRNSSEQGFILLIAIFLLALLVISLSVAVPQISKEIQRDREVETMQRGKQYIRAIQLYYRKFGAYPPNIDALVKTDNIRFLRKRYLDPMTGKDDWKPIHWGQNKTPTAMGFFGQPLAGTTLGGVGPSGGNGLAGSSAPGSSTTGSGLNSSSSLFSSTDTSTTSTNPSGTSSSTAAAGATGTTGSTAAGGSANTSSSSSSTSDTGLSGQTFGGAGIIGFSPGSPKQSILVYKKKNHYNEWEFTYDPLQDQMTIQGGNTGNSGINGQPAGSSTSGLGSTTGSGIGSSPITTPTPTPPTQPQ